MTSQLLTDLSGNELAVSTRDLTKWYGWERALDRVALQVPTGAVYLLVGPNGAGKSTALKILVDLVRPSDGSVDVLGRDVRKQAALVRANVGYVPEHSTWGYGWMRAGRLLEHHSRFFPSWDAEYARHLHSVFEISLDRKVSALSKGQARRVHLAMALAHRPPLLLLDEPTDGLDPVMRDVMLRVLAEHLSDTPTTVILSTHHVTEVEQLADHIGVLRNGELSAQVPTSELRRDLRRYRAEIPEGWNDVSLFGDAVLRRVTTRNEVEWTIWGEEAGIVEKLTTAGAIVRDAQTLSLEEATLALLAQPGVAA